MVRVLKIISRAAVGAAATLATALVASPAHAGPAPGTPSGSFYAEVINRDSLKCMNVRGGSGSMGAAIQNYHCDHTPAAKFLFRDMGEDPAVREWYAIENQHSRYCVSPHSWGDAGPDDLVQTSCRSTANDMWTLAWEPNGYYRIINQQTDKCISTNWERADGKQLIEEACRAGDLDQDWSLRIG
jgi:hypothetical protein